MGYLTTETAVLASSSAVRFNDVVTSMALCVADFRAANPDVNIVIALGHAGTYVCCCGRPVQHRAGHES